jgi:hypothetical protein
MAVRNLRGWSALLWLGLFVAAILPVASSARASDVEPALERPVTLDGTSRTRREALEEICRQASIPLQLDTDALAAAGFDLDEPASCEFVDEPLQFAIGRIIDWQANLQAGICRVPRAGVVVLTTLQSIDQRTLRQLPEWLKPLHGHGLLASVDEAGDVSTLTVGTILTDDLLARLDSLPKLREVTFQLTKSTTPAELVALSKLKRLEKLGLHGSELTDAGLGDEALKHASKLGSLRELTISDCGTTDAGMRFLEGMPHLTHLNVQDGRVTDEALTSIATIQGLKFLSLSSYVGSAEFGWMRFSPAGLQRLTSLKDLKELHLVGQSPAAEFFGFPKLTSLSVGQVDDAAATRIAACRQLRTLELFDANISDAGLRHIAMLPELRRLSIKSRWISDAGIAHLKGLPRLQSLELRASRVSDVALSHISEMKSLTQLNLYGSGRSGYDLGTCFTANGLRQLKDLARLRMLYLTNLKLNGEASALGELSQLRVLSFMMTDIDSKDLDDLAAALPHAGITDGSSKYTQPQRESATQRSLPAR